MRTSRGLTLIEVLVCVSIIAVVAAITYPVVANAKDSALKTKSISNMRQVHLALEIYAQENNGTPTGTMESMGLPPWPSAQYLGEGVRELYPPRRPTVNWTFYAYNPLPTEVDKRDPTWAQYTAECGTSAVLIWDPFFNPPRTEDFDMYWKDPYVRKFAMGITVSGSLVRKTRTGYMDLRWWMD
jgi:prepilin-type N-terminal cleavage/methylation domain-containing protein